MRLIILAYAPITWAQSTEDLNTMSLDDLLKVNVTGASKYEQKQTQVAANVRVITRNEIKTFGWRTIDEALASLPGLAANNDRQYTTLTTRGFGVPGDFNTRIQLTVDGNRVNDVVFDSAYFGRKFPVDIDLIERIEFIPGPGGAVYGQNAVFGVVNVITRKGTGIDGTELTAAYHDPVSGKEGRLTWGKKLDNGLDAVLSASGYSAKGEDKFYVYPGAGGSTVSGVAAGLDGERAKSLFGHLTYGPWMIESSYSDQRKDDPTASFYGDPLLPGQYQRDRSLLTQLQYQDKFADDTLQLTGCLFQGQQRYTGQFINSGTTTLSTGSSDWMGGELRLLSTHWNTHKLLGGLEYQNNLRQDQTSIDFTNPANNIIIPSSGWRTGVYAQDEWTLTRTLNLTLGLRYDRNNVVGGNFSPRGGLIWQATPTTTLKALYGRAHRTPNAYERLYGDVTQEANQKLSIETVDTLELVIDQRIGSSLLVNISAYQWTMQNFIYQQINPLSGLLQYQNTGQIKANGVELSADKTWDWGGRLRSSVSYQESQLIHGPKLDNSPQLMGKLNFSSPLLNTGLRLGYELQYYSKRQISNSSDLNPYYLSNMSLMADKWVKGLTVSLGIYNLFDTPYQNAAFDSSWQSAINQNGRQFRLKAVYNF